MRGNCELHVKVQLRRARASLYLGDALDFLDSLPDGSIDLFFTSPPYCIGKEYDRTFTPADFLNEHNRILNTVLRKVKKGGSICWQVGFHSRNSIVVPLDALVYSAASAYPELKLRNRLIWTFAHGTHAARRFSGRHETVLWFTKGDAFDFDLNSVRVAQKYPGKRHYKGARKGEWSGNPLGKNPGDVWEIPNVKAGHPEKTDHPCQFPTVLVRRFVKALTKPGQLVVDPYLGSGTTAVAALLEGRSFSGTDIESDYLGIASERLQRLITGELSVREDTPPRVPKPGEAVSRIPPHFRRHDADEAIRG